MPSKLTPRFAFGRNWSRFLDGLDETQVTAAEASLRQLLSVESLAGRRVLDVGSGSGLFSLAALRLGAASVCSFDLDPESVDCAHRLKERFLTGDSRWTIAQGSVLDAEWMAERGEADLVYAWGVLHHPGAMWTATAHVMDRVAPGGQLVLALYNDQGDASHRWSWVKHVYVTRGPVMRGVLIVAVAAWLALRGVAARVGRWITPDVGPVRPAAAGVHRGMSRWHDLLDWVGGYPFEVASPDAVPAFARERHLVLERLRTVGGHHGNNQFVFRRPTA